MKIRVWHLSDSPHENLGAFYLHREVEDFMKHIIEDLSEEEWVAPDLAGTDAAGLTTFVAAYGLGRLVEVDAHGMGRLGEYPGEMVFIGMAIRLDYFSTTDNLHTSGSPQEPGLRLRGLVVDKIAAKVTMSYLRTRVHEDKDKKIDLLL